MTTSVTSVTEYRHSQGGTGTNRNLCASDGLLFIVLPEIPFQMLISCSLLLLLMALAVLHTNYLSKVFSKQMCSFLIFGFIPPTSQKKESNYRVCLNQSVFFFKRRKIIFVISHVKQKVQLCLLEMFNLQHLYREPNG